MTADRYYRYY